jgi:hypothetical protein
MRTLKIGLAAAAVFGALLVVSAVPALALELPDVHVLSGEIYPATLEGSVEGTEVDVLETELGEKLTASSVHLQLELTELSSLGPMTITLTGIFEPRSKVGCHTSGDAEGTVKFGGEYHIVDTSTSPLTAALLILFKELVMECGKFKLKVRSPAIMKLEKITSGVDLNELGILSKCIGKGKQELKEYLNDEGKGVKGVLTINAGLGFETACENVTKELVAKSSKMVDLLF